MDVTQAIHHYCNYQERCQQEVRDKLYQLGCGKDQVEEVIAELIEGNLLNEERFAKAIARGKFKMNQWGRVKIVQQLKSHHISEYCINKGLKEIDDNDYELTLKKLFERKWLSLKSERNIFSKKAKVFRYLQQKGFETPLITEIINKTISKDY